MMLRIVKHEWRLLAADRVPWIVLAIFVLSIGYGVMNGVRWTNFQEAAIEEARKEERTRFRTAESNIVAIESLNLPVSRLLDPRNPDSAGRRIAAHYAVLPPAPLAATAVGQSDLLPYYIRVVMDSNEVTPTAAELENPHRLLSGRFDLAFVMIYLYPLLIIALSYNLISAEKEQGTLALTMSQPVKLGTLVLGKVGFRIFLFLSVLIVFSAAALWLGGIALTANAAQTRFGLWLAVVAGYGAFWFAASVAVSSLGKSSATNALALAGLWLLLVVLLPSTLNLAAKTVYPMPSRVELIQAIRLASDDAQAEGSSLLARFYEDHPELAAAGPGTSEQSLIELDEYEITRLAVDEEIERRVRPVIDRYAAQLEAQQALVDRLRFLSPAVVLQDALNDIAGTGAARHSHFMSQVESFRERWNTFFSARIRNRVMFASYRAVPLFRYEDEPFSEVFSRTRINLLALIAPAVIGLAGLRRIRRYPVTG